MDYLEIEITCDENYREILMAELSETGFDTFMETDDGFIAYIEKPAFDPAQFERIVHAYNQKTPFVYETRDVKDKNWIEKSYPYEITINPRMSFGTGHHETTYLMLSHQLEIDHSGKSALDVGCGAGILSIMASLAGAARVLGIDNNDWAYENARDNVSLNGRSNIEIRLGDIHTTGVDSQYDIILANINRNVLLEEVPRYAGLLNENGILVLSGFYEWDEEDIIAVTDSCGVKQEARKTKNSWSALRFKK